MILTQIERYLNDHRLTWRLLRHDPTTGSQWAAAEEGISGWQIAKSVAVELGSGEEVICVVPAPALVDLDALVDETSSRDAILCEAARLLELFPGCEEGAAPPFGGLWSLPLIFDPSLRALDRILVQGGTRDTLIELVTDEYLLLEQPILVHIAVLPGEPWKHAMPETPGPHSWDRPVEP